MIKACLMGSSVKHSRSPWVYQQFAKQFGLTLDYELIEPKLDGFVKAVESFRKTGAQGMTITAPFKIEAFNLADEVSARARYAGSANTFLFKDDGKIYADNSDGVGIVNDIVRNHQFEINNKRVLLLGAGGATRGMVFPLLKENPQVIVIANRTLEKAQALQERFSGVFAPSSSCSLTAGTRFKFLDPVVKLQDDDVVLGCCYEDLANQSFDLIIDCTSCTDRTLPLPNSLSLSTNSFCYDMKYTQPDLPFLKWAKVKNANKIANGLGMLVEQAVVAFQLWTKKTADAQPVLTAIAKEVNGIF